VGRKQLKLVLCEEKTTKTSALWGENNKLVLYGEKTTKSSALWGENN